MRKPYRCRLPVRDKSRLAKLGADTRGDSESFYPGFLSGGIIIKTRDGKEIVTTSASIAAPEDRALTGAESETRYFNPGKH